MAQTNTELLEQLSHLATIELAKCDAANTPNVCRMNATPEGADAVREAVIRKCLETGCGVGQAIIELETEYGFTGHD